MGQEEGSVLTFIRTHNNIGAANLTRREKFASMQFVHRQILIKMF
jgi:hypothetical protein